MALFANREAAITDSLGHEQPPHLSIVIPAYNEERRLPSTLARLHDYLSRQSYRSEIVVVSNGSTDGTDAIVLEAVQRFPDLRLISIPERGKGRAVREGALHSRGQIVFLCDADLSMPPEHLAPFLLAAEDADVVVGSREALGARRYDEPWHRHLMGRVFNGLVQLLIVPDIRDTQCGFKAFRREAADTLFPLQTIPGWGFDVELLHLARKNGYRIRELGIEWYFDADTRVRPGIDTLGMLREILLVRLRDLRGQYHAPANTVAAGEDHA